MTSTLAVHIAAGGLALVGGFVALAVRKGAGLHATVGLFFVGAMLVMCASAMTLYVQQGDYRTAFGTTLVAYLVISAMLTMRRHTDVTRRIHQGLAPLAFLLAANGIVGGLQTFAAPGARTANGVPAPMILLFGLVALLACWGDVRVLRHGPRRGAARLRRHLWRMCFALFVASGSFFLGQAQVIPERLRVWPILIALGVLPLLAMPYHAWRVRSRRPKVAASVPLGASAHSPL